ncbi:MAG TPA: hypothetical protein VFS40_05415 [Gemmatimonadales bacterium]|nr:hypothetical protein [Gemmatimonadales bacterium]
MPSPLTELEQITWLAPWVPDINASLEHELNREVAAGHPLHGRRATAVARRHDNGDVLYYLPDAPQPLAVVGLTFTRSREIAPEWPRTEFYASAQEWIERRMKPDHRAYAG